MKPTKPIRWPLWLSLALAMILLDMPSQAWMLWTFGIMINYMWRVDYEHNIKL
jgi:hypothetical protein